MVNFVRPNLLGTSNDFKSRFKNPIEQGQNPDATNQERIKMAETIYLLQTHLEGCIHRANTKVMVDSLQKKCEFAIKIRWSAREIDLIKAYLREMQKRKTWVNLFKARSIFLSIGAHPGLLLNQKKKVFAEVISKEVRNC